MDGLAGIFDFRDYGELLALVGNSVVAAALLGIVGGLYYLIHHKLNFVVGPVLVFGSFHEAVESRKASARRGRPDELFTNI